MKSGEKNFFCTTIALLIAALIWISCLGRYYHPNPADYRVETGIAPKAHALAARHLAIWMDEATRNRELARMFEVNPEWDFMSRTFFVLALANMALRDPAMQSQALEIIDTIIDNTLRIERERGLYHFLMGYSKDSPWVMQPARSQFVDGEIAIMLAARRMVAEKPEYRAPLAERIAVMIGRMEQSPVLLAESYPDECWLFCNAVGLAAIRMSDALDGTDHSAFLKTWIATAKTKLLDPQTGLLIAAATVRGTPAPAGEHPEGSTIWLVNHMLQLIDPDFAADQYRRARLELGRSIAGFGYAREWPAMYPTQPDIDSGPIVPLLNASAGSSGLAMIGAAAFGDADYFTRLLASLNFAAFPVEENGQLKYLASNPVGDAVMLYAMVLGPLWAEVERRAES